MTVEKHDGKKKWAGILNISIETAIKKAERIWGHMGPREKSRNMAAFAMIDDEKAL